MDSSVVQQIEAGDFDGAVQTIGVDTPSQPDSLSWYQQKALVLLSRAEELEATGDDVAGQRIAAAAIQLIAHGLAKSGAVAAAGDRAESYALMADVWERHMGDRAKARQDYERALLELPEHEGAKNALARFDDDARKARRIQARGNGS